MREDIAVETGQGVKKRKTNESHCNGNDDKIIKKRIRNSRIEIQHNDY